MQYLRNLQRDLPASIVVFIVALPLCLGVALASGAPLMSGVLAGVIGGIVVGSISNSHTSVSGPAAGLTAVVLSGIMAVGSFEAFLLAVLIAGVLQIGAGLAKGGALANYIPSNVVKGLLAAIGIILILKQIPHAVGFDRNLEDDFSFNQRDGENTFSELALMLNYFNLGAVILSVISLFILIFWDKTSLKKLKYLPSSLFVVVLGVVLNGVFNKFFPELAIGAEHLVNIPEVNGIDSLITLPDFGAISNPQVWIVALTIAVVASLETLLNLEAVQNIDPYKRIANSSRELLAQGIGNSLSGLVGGLPITSVIVRSSVNINANVATKMSTILHGIFLLVSVLLLCSVFNLIPLASLACILLVTGYKLTKVALYRDMYKKGWSQFIPFLTTVLAIVFTDLLVGVLIGLGVSIFFILISNFKNPFVLQRATLHKNEIIRLELPNQVSFLNKASIKSTLWNLPESSSVVIDATYSDYIDSDVLEVIELFRDVIATGKKIKLNVIGLKKNYEIEDHIQFVDVLDKASQEKLTPDEILDILKTGNERFLTGNHSEKYLKQQASATTTSQNPFAIVLSCIDSRTTTEHIFDLGLGDIFSVRIAGNILNTDILGSMEFAVHYIGVKLVVVLGHTHCGAIKGACDNVELGHLSHLLNKIKPAIEQETTIALNRNGQNIQFVDRVAELNVINTIDKIRKESSIIRELEMQNKIKLVGGMYNLETGEVTFYHDNN
jgi:MFS superfamily sulfate permease-like transporter